jgi:hemerythrin
MKWSEDYVTGVGHIDDQHKMLFRMAEDFRAALDEGPGGRVYGSFLQSLDAYAHSHFQFEEGHMDRCHCPVAQENREAHLEFTQVLSRYAQNYAASGFARADARSLTDTMDRWLVDHICGIDVHLKDWVVGQ